LIFNTLVSPGGISRKLETTTVQRIASGIERGAVYNLLIPDDEDHPGEIKQYLESQNYRLLV